MSSQSESLLIDCCLVCMEMHVSLLEEVQFSWSAYADLPVTLTFLVRNGPAFMVHHLHGSRYIRLLGAQGSASLGVRKLQSSRCRPPTTQVCLLAFLEILVIFIVLSLSYFDSLFVLQLCSPYLTPVHLDSYFSLRNLLGRCAFDAEGAPEGSADARNCQEHTKLRSSNPGAVLCYRALGSLAVPSVRHRPSVSLTSPLNCLFVGHRSQVLIASVHLVLLRK